MFFWNLLFPWCSGCWQFYLWFLCLFQNQLEHQEFTVHILLKPGLENFEHYFTSVWHECNCAVVWAFFGIAFLWDWNESWPFPVLWPLLNFPNLLDTLKCSTLRVSSFRIWNSLAGIPSLPLALFTVYFPKATWLHIPGCLPLGGWSHHHDYLGHEDLFCIIFLCFLAISS